ncbi:MAG: NAD(+)/NADH kinase, partial [Gemmatimonadales bacterium]
HKGGIARVVRFQVLIDGEPMGPVSGDGLVVASPTGSTAYSLSAGGPVVVPTLNAMIVTPICAHSLSLRPLVVCADAVFHIEPIDPRPDEMLVSFDGQQTATLGPHDVLDVHAAKEDVVLVRFGESGFFRTLRDKLQWGDLSDRE